VKFAKVFSSKINLESVSEINIYIVVHGLVYSLPAHWLHVTQAGQSFVPLLYLFWVLWLPFACTLANWCICSIC